MPFSLPQAFFFFLEGVEGRAEIHASKLRRWLNSRTQQERVVQFGGQGKEIYITSLICRMKIVDIFILNPIPRFVEYKVAKK